MTTLPLQNTDTDGDVAAELLNLITANATILFVVLGTSADAQTLLSVAGQQLNTGSPAWTRGLVSLKTNLTAVGDPSLAPYLTNGALQVAATDLAFTIGFQRKVAAIFHPGDSITAYDVLAAFAAAESQT